MPLTPKVYEVLEVLVQNSGHMSPLAVSTDYGPQSALVRVTSEPKRCWYSAEVRNAQTAY